MVVNIYIYNIYTWLWIYIYIIYIHGCEYIYNIYIYMVVNIYNIYIHGCEYIYIYMVEYIYIYNIYGNPHGMVQFLCYPSPWPFAPGYLPADPDTPAEDLHNGHAHWAGTSTVERPPVMGDGGGNKMCSSRTMKLYGPRATNMIKYDQIWSNM